MRMLFGGVVSLFLTTVPALASPLLAVQAGSAASDQKTAAKAPPAQPLTIVGCVQGDGVPGKPFTLSDAKDGTAYRLTGKSLRAYVGKRVQVVGDPNSRRVTIVGGLVPSANVAAQAGAMDPARAAVASDPLSTATKSDQELPELRVKSVRGVTGDCEK